MLLIVADVATFLLLGCVLLVEIKIRRCSYFYFAWFCTHGANWNEQNRASWNSKCFSNVLTAPRCRLGYEQPWEKSGNQHRWDLWSYADRQGGATYNLVLVSSSWQCGTLTVLIQWPFGETGGWGRPNKSPHNNTNYEQYRTICGSQQTAKTYVTK